MSNDTNQERDAAATAPGTVIKGRAMTDAEFETRIRAYAATNGGRCPTDRELRDAMDHGLRGEIARRGGLKRAAAALGIGRMQAYSWDRQKAVAVWIAAQAITGQDIPPKSWFEERGYSGALTLLRRAASAEPGGVARMHETAAWVAAHVQG